MVKTFCHPDDLIKWPDFDAEPVPHTYLSELRQYIRDHYYGKVLMLDDDFNNWSRRRSDGRYTKATIDEINEEFDSVESMLDDYPLVGIGQRYMANSRPLVVRNGRINGAIGMNTEILKKHGMRFRGKVMADFDMVLQCLTKGFEVYNLSKIVYEQPGSNTAGGCSTYRSIEVHNEGAKELAARWPGLVRVVEKTTKGSWGGTTRLDVVVSWKKAYNGT
jgi:hypothetical protein